jgi:hypothetical protein
MEQVKVNIDRVNTKQDIELIEMVDDSDPYLALLGIVRAFNDNVVLNIKQ